MYKVVGLSTNIFQHSATLTDSLVTWWHLLTLTCEQTVAYLTHLGEIHMESCFWPPGESKPSIHSHLAWFLVTTLEEIFGSFAAKC